MKKQMLLNNNIDLFYVNKYIYFGASYVYYFFDSVRVENLKYLIINRMNTDN